MSVNNDGDFVKELHSTSESLFAHPPEDQTVESALLAKIDAAAQQHLISPSLEVSLKSSLSPLKDRQITTLSTEEKAAIFQIFQNALQPLPQEADEGIGSAASAAEEPTPTAKSRTPQPKISKDALSQRTKACSSALKAQFQQGAIGTFQVEPVKESFKELVDLGFEDFQLTTQRIDLTISPQIPNGFLVQMQALAQLSHRQATSHPEVPPSATFTIEGSVLCRVNIIGDCVLENCHFNYIAKLNN